MVEIKNKQGEVIYTYDGESLSNVILRNTDLSEAALRRANLKGVNLSGVFLRGADLRGANLSFAYLSGVDLRGANLSFTDLSFTDLRGVNLRGVNLTGANTEFGVLQNIMQVSNIGCRNDTTVVYHTEQGIFIKCGCFKGSLAEFEAKVKETHKDNIHEKAYLAMIELVKVRFAK